MRIDEALLRDFAAMNADLVPSAVAYSISYDTPLMKLLHASKAVIILDEHGHAYNQLKEQSLDPSYFFPFLMPNSYLNARNVRCVFAGSNPARFEGELNGTYRNHLRFIIDSMCRTQHYFWRR